MRSFSGFRLFAFTWTFALLIHQLSFSDWRWSEPTGILLTAAVLAVLLVPLSWRTFLSLMIIDWLCVAWNSPHHANHIFFAWIVNGTLISSFFVVWRKGMSDLDIESTWFEAFAPWLRAELCILYFFAAFHKLNVSYFNVDGSCSSLMFSAVAERLHIIPDSAIFRYLTIYGTFIVEAILPVMLIFRQTRAAGIVVGLLFHGALALHPHLGIFSFSTTMAAMYISFLPVSFLITPEPPKILITIWRILLWSLAALLGLWTLNYITTLPLPLWKLIANCWKIGILVYYIFLGSILFLLIKSFRAHYSMKGESPGIFRLSILSIFPLLLLINGFGPYFGLRTESSLSMFSNLHTENGQSNHLLMPAGIQFTEWQYDLAEIIDSNNSYLVDVRDQDLLVPILELRRMAMGSDLEVTFRYRGKVLVFDKNRPETYATLPPLGFFARRYFSFRAVDKDPLRTNCLH